jgi:hypothetical protein
MLRSICSIFSFLLLISSCNQQNSSKLGQYQYAQVRDSVQEMARQIAIDVSRNGPIAWLRHFSDTDAFFMASDGQLMFPNYDSASSFIQNKLIKMMSRIELSWTDIRIDPLSEDLAILAAHYKETITDSASRLMNESGYFTCLAQRTNKGWQLRNAHWSLLPQKEGS